MYIPVECKNKFRPVTNKTVNLTYDAATPSLFILAGRGSSSKLVAICHREPSVRPFLHRTNIYN